MKKFMMRWVDRPVQWFKHLKLSRKLILIHFILIVIPFGLLGFFAYSSFTKTMEDNVGNYQLQTLNQLTLNMDTYLHELNRLTLMPYQYPEILDYLESKRKPGQPLTLQEIDELNNFVSQVFLTGRTDIMGVSLYGESGASYVVLPESQYVTTYKLDESAQWLKSVEDRKGQPTFMATHEVKSTSGTAYQVFSIARELRSFNSGKRLGYIVIDVNPTVIENILSQVTFGEKESIYVVDKHGSEVVQKDGSAMIHNLALEVQSGVTLVEADQGDWLVAHVISPLTEWTTVGVVPVSELMKDSKVISKSVMVFGVVCVSLALVFSVFIAIRITKPLRELSQLMRKVERGDLQVSFPVIQHDEVGRLGNAFNMMVSRLSELGYLLYETEIREKDAQIAALQSKINPHFLYNTLGSISMYAEVEGNREIVDMANNLSKLLRYSLSGKKERVTLRDELEHVKGYMTIQKMRYEERIHFELDIDDYYLECQVIPLMIQPIVENAINHGLDKGVGEGRIRLSTLQEERILTIIVEDDGVGLTMEQLDEIRKGLNTRELGGKTGNGLLNVHRRILLHFGEPYGLSLESMPFQGMKVVMKLPVIRQ